MDLMLIVKSAHDLIISGSKHIVDVLLMLACAINAKSLVNTREKLHEMDKRLIQTEENIKHLPNAKEIQKLINDSVEHGMKPINQNQIELSKKIDKISEQMQDVQIKIHK